MVLIKSFLENVMNRFRKNKERHILAEVLTDSRAVFSSFGKNVYLSDLVNNCIDRIAVEISKIEVVSVIEKEGSITKLNDDISRLFRFQPNELQPAKDFLSCCEWLRRKNMNCFIYPEWETVQNKQGKTFRKYKAFYSLNPISAELGHFEDGRWAIKFFWRDGSYDVLPYDAIIHLRWRRGTSTLMGGGDDYGHADERDILKSLEIHDKMLQAMPKMLEAGMNFNGILKIKSLQAGKMQENTLEEFENRFKQSELGILATDLAADFQPLDRKFPQIPETVMKFVKDIIRERYGISDAILSGDYTSDQHSAFYQSCIEDFIVEFEQAFSKRLFTDRERDVGHRVKGYYTKVAYYSTKEKMELAKLATETGLITLNQLAEIFGYPPFAGGDRRIQSLNYANTEIVDQYQIKNAQSRKENTSDGKE